MECRDLELHLINVVLKSHDGNMTAAANELGMSVSTLKGRRRDAEFSVPSPTPLEDALILVEILREYLPQLCGDDRLHVFHELDDGYCAKCGSDAYCECGEKP